MVDKDLFLYDLAIVAILKNEGPYLKEWLDYHLLTGVDHFYLYDNESPDNQAEVAAPYVEADLVTYIPFPGKAKQMVAYNDAIKRFKFQSRYMAFIDGDEFIYPKINSEGGVVELIDNILSLDPNAAGLAINWQIFGSNGQEKADYSRGVLERFTQRAKKNWGPNSHIKTIANPRNMDRIGNPHFAKYFEEKYTVNENGDKVPQDLNRKFAGAFNIPVTVEKIALNHYHTKSHEEYATKRIRGIADKVTGNNYQEAQFKSHDRNDEFDDGILKYRDERAKVYQPPEPRSDSELLKALERNLSPTLQEDTSQEFYAGKIETFLTCRAVAAYLKTRLKDTAQTKLFEEAALKAILKSLQTRYSFADAGLLVKELPELLKLPYPVVKELRHL